MKEKLDLVKVKGDEALKDMGIIIDEIAYETEGKYNFLKIVLDKVNGLDLETVVEATNILNPIVDKIDISDDSYILDISSKEKGDKNE